VNTRTVHLSPKVPAQAISGAAAWALGYYVLKLSPDAAAALAVAVGSGAGYAAPPGTVDPILKTDGPPDGWHPGDAAPAASTPPPSGGPVV
jgi:hypothetical protein